MKHPLESRVVRVLYSFLSRKDTASSRGVCEDPKVADED